MKEGNINSSTLHKETHILPNAVIMKEIIVQVAEGRSVELLCRGNSMNPFLVDRRDSLVLSPIDPADLKVGDVVLARIRGGHFVVHRIASLDPFQLNGDGNSASSREMVVEVVALMSGYIRKGKKGIVKDAKWLRYSRFWSFCSRVGVGSWTLRRIILGFFRRVHKPTVG